MNLCRPQHARSSLKSLTQNSICYNNAPCQRRLISNSPYGRAHVWKRRPPVLPNPVVPKFPQQVIRSDGTSFIQWTTSPKSLVRLTRDTTNNPMYNPAAASGRGVEEESGTTGRLGRFNRRYEELGAEIGEMATPVEEPAAKKEAAKPKEAKKAGQS
ncbi:hypothetical protein CC1G_02083 [Coprinopsis cinerea okayama7|uniref:50S ribosomal protein L36 n=1 Tax=Coprinopsis cinerea (strain Okayama-7 / 130 / ATCC MYA-4618 / FGSC 9003) TaxID=240176 RepID=A8NK44_COPC7|nr:hypothetical protein CC1G_02083 [Coprinopsis cinerea okayama7\|eukprot:XP_001834347.1 hypothetical protein CC1G_02083 [Coprinopsis cinerea okayama7\